MYNTLIFDLDGTLLNSIEDIAICMNEVLKSLNLKSYEIDEYKYFVGHGIDILVDNVLKMLSPDGSVMQLMQSENQPG